MVITLLADPHIASTPAETNGVDTQVNFNRAVSRIRELHPDFVILMGDYSAKEPRLQDVRYACSRLQLAEVPFAAIAGNHDDSRTVAEVCGGVDKMIGEELYFRRDFGLDRCLFLDTAKGYIDGDQFDWLKLNLDNARGRILVFMHHPPLHMGVPYMDKKYALQDRGKELYKLLFSQRKPVHVFCGHYHAARSTQVGIHSVHICPSTFFQIDASKEEFVVSHSLPGLRHIELLEGQVRTWVEILK